MFDLHSCVDAVVKHRVPMKPIQSGVMPDLSTLEGVKSVVFDVYGTLLLSGSGDVGAAGVSVESDRIAEAIQASGLDVESAAIPTERELRQHINSANEARKSDQCPVPEVDIVDIWRHVLESQGVVVTDRQVPNILRLASHYEAIANPTWPMTGAAELLKDLRAAGLVLGIVSNAQVFTIPLIEDLLRRSKISDIGSLESGFQLDLCIFSNRFRQAKPGPRLFDALREALGRNGIRPSESLYVGNDMLNDIWAASMAGMRTAWFAGDIRSCRRRADDARCRSLRPDIVLTELMQLPTCLGLE